MAFVASDVLSTIAKLRAVGTIDTGVLRCQASLGDLSGVKSPFLQRGNVGGCALRSAASDMLSVFAQLHGAGNVAPVLVSS